MEGEFLKADLQAKFPSRDLNGVRELMEAVIEECVRAIQPPHPRPPGPSPPAGERGVLEES